MGCGRYKDNHKLVVLLLVLIFSINLHSEEWGETILIEQISSSGDDYSPNYNSNLDKFFFVSDVGGKSKIYQCDYSNYENIEQLKGGINITSKNSNYISFINKNKAVFSSFRMGERQAYQNLFYSSFQKQSWTKGELIEELSGDFFISHPTISPDGNSMIFSSNKDNEFGDSDLYICYRSTDGTWEKPISLDEINSPGMEITPYLASQDTLYFSSDGQGGEGGFDIFVSIKELGFWQRPKPVVGLNTSFNESDPCRVGKTLFFASDRQGGKGGLDLYRASLKKNGSSELQDQVIQQDLPELVLSTESIQIEVLQEYDRIIKITEDGSIRLVEFSTKSDFIIYPETISIRLSDAVEESLLLSLSSQGITLDEKMIKDKYTADLRVMANNLINSDKLVCSLTSPTDKSNYNILIRRTTNKRIKIDEIGDQNVESIRIDKELLLDEKVSRIPSIIDDQLNSGVYKDFKVILPKSWNFTNEDLEKIKNIFNNKLELSENHDNALILLQRAY